MKRISKIIAVIVTLAVLLALAVTTAFADVTAYSHPALSVGSAKNHLSENFEDDTVGSSYGTSPVNMVRFSGAMKKIKESAVFGNSTSNKYLKIESAPDNANPFIIGSANANERSVYMQLRPQGNYKTPTYWSGTYDNNLADGFDSNVKVNYDYMTFDFDISAAGARVEYIGGTYGRAESFAELDDGSVRVVLTDGTVVVTSSDKTVTAMTALDGTVTLWETESDGVRSTVTYTDGGRTVSFTAVNSDGTARKTVTSYDADGNELSREYMTRTAPMSDGSYTVTYDNGRTVSYAVTETSSETTEVYTVTSGGTVTVYSSTVSTSSTGEVRTKSVTVDGVTVGSNVSTYPKSGSVTHLKEYESFDAEWEALTELDENDIYGMHVEDIRVVYAPINCYNTVRYAKVDKKTENDTTTYSYSWTSRQNYYYVQYLNGSWGVFAEGTSEANRIATLPDEIGVWTHISIIYAPDPDDYRSSTSYFFVNGEYLHTSAYTISSTYVLSAVEDFRINVTSSKDLLPSENERYWAVAFDNCATNVYVPEYDTNGTRNAYSSGDLYGIDNLINDIKKNGEGYLTDCQDTVFGSDYRYPHGERYVKVDSGDRIYIPKLQADELMTVRDGSCVETTADIVISVPEGVTEFTVVTPNDSTVLLDSDSFLEFKIALVSEADGVKTYSVAPLSSSDKITLEWVDPLNNVIRTEEFSVGRIADPGKINASVLNLDTMQANVVTGWYWDLDGEGSLYSEAPASSITTADVALIGGSTVTVYPKTATVDFTSGMDYIAYYSDGETLRLSDLTTSNFANINNLSKSVAVFPDGTVLKFISDDEVVKLKKDTSYNIGGISLTVDLNGKTVNRVMSSAYPSGVFRVGEGGSIVITSSVEGARVFLACNRSKTTENTMYGTDGLVEVLSGVDLANVTLSNFEFNGGTMVKAAGGLQSNDTPEYSNDVPITVNVDNVVVNAPLRSSYGVFSTLAPDVVINITDSKFYLTNTTYALFHDYSSGSSSYYKSETDVTMRGCEVIAMSEAETPGLAKLWYSMGAESSFYAENTRIIAKLGHNTSSLGGEVTFGEGVVIATDSFGYFDRSKISYAEGVTSMFNREEHEYDLTLSFTRSGFVSDYSLYDSENYTIADSCFTDSVKITRSYVISFASFTEYNLPEFLGSVEWLDDNGVQIVDQYYAFVGMPLTVPATLEELGCYNSSNEWYTRTYSWANYDGTPVPDCVVQGVSSYAPLLNETTHISGKKASVTLSSGIIFNLYLPVPDKSVKEGSVYSDDAIGKNAVETTVNGFKMLKLSFLTDTADLTGKTVSVCFMPRTGKALRYEVEIDTLLYASSVIENGECGSSDSKLAYELVAYKKAFGECVGKSLSDDDRAALSLFEDSFAAHGDGCGCKSGFTAEGKKTVPNYSYYGISNFEYIHNGAGTELRISVNGNVTVKKATYTTVTGSERIITDAIGYTATESGGCYTISGIDINDVMQIMTVTVSDGTTDTDFVYSLVKHTSLASSADSTASAAFEVFVSYAGALSSYKND